MPGTPHGPLEKTLQHGITAVAARRLLEEHDCLTFPRLSSGMFPAANFDDIPSNTTGMANAWLRDSAFVGLALLYDGQMDEAAAAVRAIIGCLHKTRSYYEQIIDGTHSPSDYELRPPVSFKGMDSQPRTDWGSAQNDSQGYTLQLIGRAVNAGALDLEEDDRAVIELLPAYLKAISYWKDRDLGHWEEDKRCNAPSIGVVVAGLEASRAILSDSAMTTFLIEQGQKALASILPNESLGPTKREYDSALIFLVEPAKVVTDEMADRIMSNVEQYLVGERGIRRYNGDSYWAPNFRRLRQESDTSDLATRNRFMQPGGEAQWTIFDPVMAAYYARRFKAHKDQASKTKANYHMVRALRQIVTHQKNNAEVWRIPEAFFKEDGKWVPNDHLGLLWAQANLLYALDVYKEIFGDELIKITISVEQ